jgi:hypothetical protein
MKVTLAIVPPNGGETDYSLDFEVPALPRPGDYISVRREDASGRHGTEDFIVRRVWWHLCYPDSLLSRSANDTTTGKTDDVVVECEFARGPFSTEAHKAACDVYAARGKEPKSFDPSAY